MNTRKLLATIITVAVLIGLGKMPYGYYSLLRLTVSAFSLFLLFGGNAVKAEWQRWLLGAIAVLYNPVLPIAIGDKEIWIVLNIATVLLFWFIAADRSRRHLG